MANIRATNTTSTLVLPRQLREEVRKHSDKTGESFGEVTRRALAAYLERQREWTTEIETEQQ
jgi:hypothetical protein